MTRRERFYKSVSLDETDDGFAILLDGRKVRTPERRPLLLENRPIGEAVAKEWSQQGDEIDPLSMPLTRLANSTIDQVMPERDKIVDQLVQYVGSDLTCYRADHPLGLQDAQAASWDLLLDWFHHATGSRLLPTVGIMPIAQSDQALDATRRFIQALSAQILTSLHVATTTTGSVVIGLAGTTGHLSLDEAWEAATIDERWQRQEWGADAEALAREEKLKQDLAAAVNFAIFHRNSG